MKIVFSSHAIRDKFPIFREHGFNFTRKQIRAVVENPDHVDKASDPPKIIASKELDEQHILRVVYKLESGIIKVITFYPAEKGRYY